VRSSSVELVRHFILIHYGPSITVVGDDSKGYFIQPTVILSKDPKSVTLVEEIFGPVITVSTGKSCGIDSYLSIPQAFVFEDDDYEKTLDLIDSTTQYALTGAMYVPPP